MLKNTKRVLSVIFASVLLFNLLRTNVYAEGATEAEEKVACNATLEDEFADNRVMVVLDNETSLAVDQFSTSMFSGVRCKEVQSLTTAKEAKVQEKMSDITVKLNEVAVARNAAEIVTTENVMKIAATDEYLNSYKQVLCIELEESGKQKVLDTIAELEKLDNVVYAGPDYVLSVDSTTPDDPYYTNGNQWAIDKIDLPEAWDITIGHLSVTVAVIDSGIDADHPDLSGRINSFRSRDFTSGEEVKPIIVADGYGHGTMVAGVIGAIGDNGVGICGACWDVTLVSLKVLASNGYAYTSHVSMAINYAELWSIPIINMSLSWVNGTDDEYYDQALLWAINAYSGLFVCTAGNDWRNIDSSIVYPTNYNLSNMIVVGASNGNDAKWSDSNYGQTSVDLFAPGAGIYTTSSTGGYVTNSGTSFAAPYVAGVAALLLAKYPYLTTAELKQTILENVDIVYDSSGNSVFGNLCTSGGRLNAYKALSNRKHTHTYTYESVGVYEGHDYVCTACGATTRERHTWSTTGSLHRCVKCGLESSYRPYANNDLSEE